MLTHQEHFCAERLGSISSQSTPAGAITLPAEMAAVAKSAVDAGDYASTREVIRAALRDWKLERALQIEELAAPKADIAAGLADVAAGRASAFDAARILKRGTKQLTDRSPSA